MILKDATIEEFVQEVNQNDYKIVVYGYGVIGKVSVPYFIQKQKLEERVLFCVDSDVSKQDKTITIGKKRIKILPPEDLEKIKEIFVLLITASRYQGIFTYLNQCAYLNGIHGYLLPQMFVKDIGDIGKYEIIKKTVGPAIPKKIHYCWFGKEQISKPMQACIDSWKKFCPDYEIIQWNESNYDIEKYDYTRQAYQCQKWAFVSDVARLEILYQNGGIYMDVDVELIKNLDELLYQPGFCGVEKWRTINTGGGCGAICGHPVIGKMLEERKKCMFEYPDGKLNLESSGCYETLPLLEQGFLPNNRTQEINGMTIYSSDFFHPYDYMTGELNITENTYGIHHFMGSWL